MTGYAIIENGIVTNMAVADPEFAAQQGWIKAHEGVSIGWTYDGTNFAPPVPPVPSQADFEQALTNHLDKMAQSHKYDNRITCAVRAGYPGPFQAEGMAFASWMDACNAFAYELLSQVEAGTAQPPASVEAFISMLPAMVWPT